MTESCRRCGSSDYLRVLRQTADTDRYTPGNVLAVICDDCGHREDSPRLSRVRAIDGDDGEGSA